MSQTTKKGNGTLMTLFWDVYLLLRRDWIACYKCASRRISNIRG
uniref:Uncharacterized protein n=1 Tax=Tetraselmis sp. GSL018 TaxID=582737 RepID=A0A061QMV9_9CHLO